MSETYIINIKNLEYFNYSLKNTVSNAEYISYEPSTKTLDIFGNLTEQDKIDIDNFIQNYPNPDKVTVSNTRLMSSSVSSCGDILDWCTLFSWKETLRINNITPTIKLEPSPTDYMHNETFRYGIRVVDVTNNFVLIEDEFYNSEYEDKTLSITNFTLSLGSLDLELQVKKYNKGNAIYIKRLSAEYV